MSLLFFSFLIAETLARIFAAQKAAGQRAPYRHAGAGRAQEGHKFVFEIARDQRIVHLSAGELSPAAFFLNRKR